MKINSIAVATPVLAVGFFMFSLVESQTNSLEEIESRRRGGGGGRGTGSSGSGGKSKGSGGKSSSGGINKYTSKSGSSHKSFGSKAVAFGAGAYTGKKIGKKVKQNLFTFSSQLKSKEILHDYNDISD